MSLGAIIECYLPFVLEDLGLIRIIILVKSRQNLPMCGLVLCFSVNQVSNLSEAEKENVVINDYEYLVRRHIHSLLVV